MSDILTIKGFAVPGGTAKYDYNSLNNIPIDNSLKYEAQSLNAEQIAQVWKNLGLSGPPSGGNGGESGGTGADGITPHIGANGNWFLGSIDTGVPATGPQGPTGAAGAPFTISKIYPSVNAMHLAYSSDGVPQGGFVVIETGDVNNEDNAKLFIKGLTQYEYITDLSGADGLVGPVGPTGQTGATGKTAYQYALDGGYEGTELQFATKLATEYLPLTGGTLSGDLSTSGHVQGNYIQGTWLQTTQATDLGGVPSKIAVISDSNWIYYRTPEEILEDIGATTLSEIQPLLDKKANDFSIEIYNGTPGNPKPVRFASFDYSTCDSENGIAAKINLVSGHGNGASYAFLEEAIIRVNLLGQVEVDNLKYYGASAGAYDGAARQYGDIFWLVDETNKIIDFYCLMGQYARLYQTPWKRLTYSNKGAVTQYTNCTVYSSGAMNWANNSNIALQKEVDTKLSQKGGTISGDLVVEGILTTKAKLVAESGISDGINDIQIDQIATKEDLDNAILGDYSPAYLKLKDKKFELPINSEWKGLAYGNNTYVAVGGKQPFVYSKDGKNWQAVSYIDSENKINLAYGGEYFVGIAPTEIVYYSKDGINWASYVLNMGYDVTDQADWTLEYVDNEFIAIGQSRSNKQILLTSSNGFNWEKQSLMIPKSGPYTYATKVYHFPSSKYVTVLFGAGGEGMYKGTNGWYNMSFNAQDNWVAAATGDAANVIVGKNGNIMRAIDAINWGLIAEEWQKLYSNPISFYDVAYGNGVFVAITGEYKKSVISTDGIIWKEYEMPIEATQIIFENNCFTAIGQGNLATSVDGINWINEEKIIEQNGKDVTDDVAKSISSIAPDVNGDVGADLTGYATEEWVQEGFQPKGEYLTEVPTGYAKTDDIPTKMSQLTNDKGYLTQHQDISGKLDASALPTAINTALNRTTSVNIADTNYTTLMARGTSLNSSETTPAVNGAIAWTYR